MIFKSSSPLSPSVDISIDNVPVNYMTLQRITVEEKENMHNMTVLDFVGMNPELMHQYLNTPIQVKIELRDRPAYTFYGYIVYLEPTSVTKDGVVNKSPFQITRAYCFGTSYKMKSKVSRTWENISLPEIATELADKYMFSVSVPDNPYRFARIAQKSESDWQFLVKVSNLLGYSVLMEDTHLRVWNPFKTVYHNVSYSMLMNIRGSRGDVSPQPGQILKFEGRIGAVTTDGARTPDTIKFLDKDGQTLSVNNGEDFESTGFGTVLQSEFENVLNINADNYAMANALATGELRKKFPMTAHVEIVADPSIRPGGLVYINEYNTEFDGFWYVNAVNHELTQSHMLTRLDISRDSMGTTTTDVPTASAYVSPPAPSYFNGKWRSSSEHVHIYS